MLADQRQCLEGRHHPVDPQQVEQVREFSMREGELRIEGDRALEMLSGAPHGLRRRGVGQMQCLQILVVGQEARHVPPRQRRRG